MEVNLKTLEDDFECLDIQFKDDVFDTLLESWFHLFKEDVLNGYLGVPFKLLIVILSYLSIHILGQWIVSHCLV